MTTISVAPMTAGRVRLEFFRKRRPEGTATTRVNTETGTMKVSTPAATVFDLVRHVRASGHLDNVATVIAELADLVTPDALARAAAAAHVTEVQRAGYLLELTGQDELAEALERFLVDRRVALSPLRPDVASTGAPRSERWKLLVNEQVEPDL